MSKAAPTSASMDSGALPSPEHLPDDPATLKTMIVELLATLRQERHNKETLQHRLDLLLRRLYGPRGERFDPRQPLLFPDMAEASQDQATPPAPPASDEKPASDEEPPAKRRCRPHGRRRMPKHLPHEPRHHELTAAERLCPGCGKECVDIGVDQSEQLEYRPASLIVIEHIVHKYACPCCGKPAKTPAAATPNPETDSAATSEAAQPCDAAPTPDVVVVPAATAAAVQQTQAAATQSPPAQPSPQECQSMPTNHNQDNDEGSQQDPPPVTTRQQGNDEGSQQDPPPMTTDRQPSSSGFVVAASKPKMPIFKGLPGPGLLAHLIVSKFVDHLPLYRLERIYERQGVILPRSTTCDWLAASARLLQPLYQLMVATVMQSRVLHTDDTPVKNQQPPPGTTDLGRMWTYLGDRDHPCNVFDFTPTRKRDGPQQFLQSFRGYLQADAFTGYDALYLPIDGVARIFEVACNAHARRKFYDARTSDALRSHQALAYYGQLYELERRATKLEFDDAQRRQMRQDLAVPILDKFHAWLTSEQAQVLPKSPMGEAFTYALNNWTALVRYTEEGFLAIDNNVGEREMKRIAIGRKNWLFVGSVQGGKTAAVLLSFTSTCARLGVEPWAYLQDVLTRIPTTPPDQLADLLPHRWQAAHPTPPETSDTSTSPAT